METTIISIKEFKEWMMSQPDDKLVDMGEANWHEGCCGCAMMQYAQFKGMQKANCGTTRIHEAGNAHEFELAQAIWGFFNRMNMPCGLFTFKVAWGELKQYIK